MRAQHPPAGPPLRPFHQTNGPVRFSSTTKKLPNSAPLFRRSRCYNRSHKMATLPPRGSMGRQQGGSGAPGKLMDSAYETGSILSKVIPFLDTSQWHTSLGHSPLPSTSTRAVSSLTQHAVSIASAGGSIGSALAMCLASVGTRTILLESSRAVAPDRQSAIEFTYLRPGDKESEQLCSNSETAHPANANSIVCLRSPSPPPSQRQAFLATLHRAVESRKLSPALTALCVLVPDYTPGRTVLVHRSTARSQVSDE